MPTCRTPAWLLRDVTDVVDGSDLGRKGLAARLAVSEAALGYWLSGREQWPLLRLRQAAEALGAEDGARLIQAVLGDGWTVAPGPKSAAGDVDPVKCLNQQLQRETRFLSDAAAAIEDGQVTLAEFDRLVRDARSAAALRLAFMARIKQQAERGQ